MRKEHLAFIFGILTIVLAVGSFFLKELLTENLFRSLVLFLFGTIITLMWYSNSIQEKLVIDFSEEEKKRDKYEEEKLKFIHQSLDRLTTALVEIFPGHTFAKSYYELKISTAREKVEDLTWAAFDREGKLDAAEPEYLRKIQKVAEDGINYDEIFIFHKDEKKQIERLKKLKFHYNNAKNKEHRKSNYSCAFYDMVNYHGDFPRIQFTIIDNEEIIFTSGVYNNKKFKIKNKELVNIFGNYYREAWELATVLIENGEVKNEEKILELLSPIQGNNQ